jgi:cysteine-rich repeat protein
MNGMATVARISLLLIIASTVVGDIASAAQRDNAEKVPVAHLTVGAIDVRLHPVTGAAASLRVRDPADLREGGRSRNPLLVAGDFLHDARRLLGLSDARRDLVPIDSKRYGYGGLHITYRQLHRGVPVFGGVFRVHFDASGHLTGANGLVIPNLEVGTQPLIGTDGAVERVLLAVRENPQLGELFHRRGRVPPSIDVEPRLVVYRQGLLRGIEGEDRLAWETEVREAGKSVERVLLDALSGEVLERLPTVKYAINREVYDFDKGTGPTFLVWKEGDPPFSGDNQAEIDGLIDFSEDVYNFFAGLSGGTHLSWDGADGPMKSTLESSTISCPNSPLWNGSSVDFCLGNVTDDLVGHEWAHAYTDATHDLANAWQPGFLAQAYSDIWGELVDQLNGVDVNTPATARSDGACSEFLPGPAGETSYRWLFGEDLTATPGPGALRDLWHPQCGGDPGRVSEGTYHCTQSDGAVSNSTVASHAFALLVDGGTYNGVTVPAIGLTKAAHIYWRAQTVYQTPASDFLDHSYALEESCQDLIGTNLWAVGTESASPVLSGIQISGADCNAVSHAIQAVELRAEPTHCEFGRLLESDPPPVCNGLGTASTISATDWETGLDAWVVGSRDRHATATTPDWEVVSYLPDGRLGSSVFADNDPDRGDCVDTFETGVMYVESSAIALPPAQPPRLAFDHWVATEWQQDGGNVKVQVNGGVWTLVPAAAFDFNAYNTSLDTAANTENNPMALEDVFSGADQGSWGGSWGRSLVDLAGLADPGDTIKLRFEFGLSGCGGRVGWYVDDVLLHSCTAEHTCGNGLLDVSEQCDDGNAVSLDGCSSACQLEVGFLCSDSAPPTGNLLADGGFEAGSPHADWQQASTNFGTPLCSDATCPLGSVVPSGGDWLAWFGGADSNDFGIVLPETGTLSQSVTIPERVGATVGFELWVGECDAASLSDAFRVLLDGQEVYATPECSETAGYVATSAAADSFADGGSHLLTLEGGNASPTGGVSSFFVDDLSLVGGPRPSICCEPTVVLTQDYTVTAIENETACVTLTAGGQYGVGASGVLGLTAGSSVVLTDGFSVDSGGALTVGLDADLPVP